ncbi:unnamed protein product [Blepharisma stoltei]|uniref:Uncharacterized protein n=1 Tax=Blepharisma stoltei TaxID=1481888 RepID=A0AAU9IGT3_9CILI|nr:unnamed protein product [Blepharisma stoltei]
MNFAKSICRCACLCFGYSKQNTVQPNIETKEPECNGNESYDSLSSIRAEIGDNGIPKEKEKYYEKLCGVLVLKEEPKRQNIAKKKENKSLIKEISKNSASPSNEKISATRMKLLSLCKD